MKKCLEMMKDIFGGKNFLEIIKTIIVIPFALIFLVAEKLIDKLLQLEETIKRISKKNEVES